MSHLIGPAWVNRRYHGRAGREAQRLHTGFRPDAIDDLACWYAADDLSDRLSDTDPVDWWPDRSPKKQGLGPFLNAQNSTFQTNEVNGLPAVDVTGTDPQALITFGELISGASTPTVFLVVNPDAVSSDALVGFGEAQVTGGRLMITSEVGVRVGGGNRIFDTAASTAAYNLITVRFNSTNTNDCEAWLDGTALGVSSTGAVTTNFQARLCVSGSWDESITSIISTGGARIAELIAYDASLSEGERLAVEDYLNAKYALF